MFRPILLYSQQKCEVTTETTEECVDLEKSVSPSSQLDVEDVSNFLAKHPPVP